MKLLTHLSIIFCLFLFFPTLIFSQNTFIEIPLGIEKNLIHKNTILPYHQMKRPKIAIALSGGGIRGLAQIGVLKVFEQYGIPIDGIAGTSIGAIIGGLFSVGYSATEIETLFIHLNWNDIIQDNPEREQLFLGQKEEKEKAIFQLRLKGFSPQIPSAFTAGQKFTTLMTEALLNAPYPIESDFRKLHVPFMAIATNLKTGEKKLLQQGFLIDALRASIAIPLLFTPVEIGGALLVDGGLVQNLPVEEAKLFGTDLVIAIDTSSKPSSVESLNTPWVIADQVTTIMQQDQIQKQLQLADISIQPDLSGIPNTAYQEVKSIIQAGEKAARNAIPLIESKLSEKSSLVHKMHYSIQMIELVGSHNLDPKILLKTIHIDTTKPVTDSDIIWAGRTLIQTGYLQSISAQIDTSTSTLIFLITENSLVKRIRFHGNQTLPDSILFSKIKTRLGDVANTQRCRLDYHQLCLAYHQRGYTLAQIDSSVFKDGNLDIYINEGQINQIQLNGNRRTKPYVILRELPLKSGQLLNASSLRRGLENIYNTGYFEDVRSHIMRNQNGYRVIIDVTERANRILRFGLRHDLERRTQVFLQLIEENLLGFGGKGAVLGLIGNRDQKMQVKLWSDRLFKTMLTYKIRFTSESLHFDYYKDHLHLGSYRKRVQGLLISLGQHMHRLGTVALTFNAEKYGVTPLEGQNIPRESYTINTITLSSKVDTRDRYPFPKKGKYHILEYETANSLWGSEIDFSKLSSSMETYIPISSYLNLRPHIQWGSSDLTTPFVKQFRMGGIDNFLGLPEEAFIGKRFITVNGELRLQLPWPKWLESYFSIRYDIGGIWNRYTNLSIDDFKQGIGGIFSMNTPLGPIQIGYGHMSDGEQQFYLSVGHRF